MRLSCLLALLCVCALPLPVSAQSAPPAPAAPVPTLSRAQSAEQAQQEAEIRHAAQQVVAMIDAGRLDEVWTGASPTVRRLVPQAEFVGQVSADRKRLGPVLSRGVPVIRREHYAAGGQVPQGDYFNVATATRFALAPQPVRELVSFRLDEDNVWRVSGYSLR